MTLEEAAVTTPDGQLLFRTGKQFICQGDRIVLLGRNGQARPALFRCCAKRSLIHPA